MRRRDFVGAAAAAAVFASSYGRARGADLVRLATIPIDPGAEPYYAASLGYFEDAGLNVEITPIGNGGSVVAAIASRSIDIGYGNVVSASEAFQRGLPLTAVAGASYWPIKVAAAVLSVARDSPIKSARDLNGKTIGTSGLRNIVQFAPQYWIDKHGGDSTTVRFVEMTFPQIVDGIAAGRIDAGVLVEPFVTQSKSRLRVIAGSLLDGYASRLQTSVWIANPAWVKVNARLATAFANVIEKTAVWANANHAASSAILAKAAKMDPAVAATMARVSYPERLSATEIQPVIDLAVRYGGLARSFPAEQLLFVS